MKLLYLVIFLFYGIIVCSPIAAKLVLELVRSILFTLAQVIESSILIYIEIRNLLTGFGILCIAATGLGRANLAKLPSIVFALNST
jgi:hypothetical protein